MIIKKPNVAFFPAHPAQLWFMYAVSKVLENKVKIFWVLRDKDVLLAIAKKLNLDYIIISRAKTGLITNTLELIKNVFRAITITKKHNIQLWLTKYGAGNIASCICRVKSISFNDDDIDIVPLIAITSYPFANEILAPKWVRMGPYNYKTTRFNASNELIYLHPERFTSSPEIRQKLIAGKTSIIFVRLSALSAHHDVGKSGISEKILNKIIDRYSKIYKIYISSEKKLSNRYEEYRLFTSVDTVHTVLKESNCIITDSLSMALEAAVLGTPTVRLSDFGLEVSAFKAIQKYGLIFNFLPSQIDQAIIKIDDLLTQSKQCLIKERSRNLIKDMEDPLPYFSNAILRHLSLDRDCQGN